MLEEERVVAEEEAMQQAHLDRERDREAGELKRMAPHDVDVGELFHTSSHSTIRTGGGGWGCKLLPAYFPYVGGVSRSGVGVEVVASVVSSRGGCKPFEFAPLCGNATTRRTPSS